jgi:hypothetical protein
VNRDDDGQDNAHANYPEHEIRGMERMWSNMPHMDAVQTKQKSRGPRNVPSHRRFTSSSPFALIANGVNLKVDLLGVLGIVIHGGLHIHRSKMRYEIGPQFINGCSELMRAETDQTGMRVSRIQASPPQTVGVF